MLSGEFNHAAKLVLKWIFSPAVILSFVFYISTYNLTRLDIQYECHDGFWIIHLHNSGTTTIGEGSYAKKIAPAIVFSELNNIRWNSSENIAIEQMSTSGEIYISNIEINPLSAVEIYVKNISCESDVMFEGALIDAGILEFKKGRGAFAKNYAILIKQNLPSLMHFYVLAGYFVAAGLLLYLLMHFSPLIFAFGVTGEELRSEQISFIFRGLKKEYHPYFDIFISPNHFVNSASIRTLRDHWDIFVDIALAKHLHGNSYLMGLYLNSQTKNPAVSEELIKLLAYFKQRELLDDLCTSKSQRDALKEMYDRVLRQIDVDYANNRREYEWSGAYRWIDKNKKNDTGFFSFALDKVAVISISLLLIFLLISFYGYISSFWP